MIRHYSKGVLVKIINTHYSFSRKNTPCDWRTDRVTFENGCDIITARDWTKIEEHLDYDEVFVDKKITLVSTIKKWFRS